MVPNHQPVMIDIRFLGAQTHITAGLPSVVSQFHGISPIGCDNHQYIRLPSGKLTVN